MVIDLKLSIITVNYNNAEALHNTIKSVISQNLDDAEYIIIDGGSTDGSVDILKQYNTQIKYWISEKDKGIYDAMNKGIIAASGTYLQFLNSGDLFYDSDVVNFEVNSIKKNIDADVIYGDVMFIDQNKKDLFLVKQPKHVDIAFFQSNTINHQSALIKKTFFDDNLHDLQYKLAGDYIKFVDMALSGSVFRHLDRVLVGYDLEGISNSGEGKHQYTDESLTYWNMVVPKGINRIITDYKVANAKLDNPVIKLSSTLNDYIEIYNGKLTQLKSFLKRIISK